MSRLRQALKTSFGAGILFTASLPAGATSFLQVPFPTSVQEAPVVVRGQVGTSYSDFARGSDGTRRLYTFSELQVSEVFKGDASGPTLIFRELGGEKDGIGMQVAGAAHFDRGEDVVVFLNPRNSDGSYDLLGLSMGKYNVMQDSSGKEYLVGMGTADNAAGAIVHEEDVGPGHSHWTLESLRQLIRDQGSAPHVASRMRPSGLPSRVPSPIPSAKRAPQLHPSSASGESARSWGWLVTLVLLGIGLAAVVFVLTRSGRK